MFGRVRLFLAPYAERIAELWRYYKIGVVNTVFGYGLFSLLVFLGLNLFVAQILSHACGMVFNYFMFRAHVFHGATPKIPAYVATYAVNYLLGLGLLAIAHRFIPSPYVAGFVALLVVSVINYFLLKSFVFKRNP